MKNRGTIASLAKRRVARLRQSANRSVEYSRRHMPLLGWCGVVSLLGYYFVWGYIYPDDYESFVVRALGALLCVPAILVDELERRYQGWLVMYWMCGVTFVLPFVFGYLLAMNALTADNLGASNVIWPLQNIVALFIFILLINDGLLATLLWSAANALVIGIVLFIVPEPNFDEFARVFLHPMPIYGFIIVVGSLAIRHRDMIEYEKLRTMAAVGSTIAHELRTPFLGIRALAEGIGKYLPTLMHSHELAIANGLGAESLRRSHMEGLKRSLERISGEIEYSNRMVDMLLVNSSESPVRAEEYSRFSAAGCIEEAIDRFAFTSDDEHELIHVDATEDFEIWAPRVVIIHVLFNLLKNSLYYIKKAGHGEIFIELKSTNGSNRIVFEDTGTGIAPEIIERIFERFFTTTEIGHGAGIGLSFCKLAMEGVGGSIRCESEVGRFTRFTLEFPGAPNGG